jgi:hypothetical protein
MADGAAQEEEQVGPLPPPEEGEEAEADVGPVLPKPKKRKARRRSAAVLPSLPATLCRRCLPPAVRCSRS